MPEVTGGKLNGFLNSGPGEGSMPRHDAFMSGLAGLGGGMLGGASGLPFGAVGGSLAGRALANWLQNRQQGPQFNLTPGDNSGDMAQPAFDPNTGTVHGGLIGPGSSNPFGNLFSGGQPGGPSPGGVGGNYGINPGGVGMFGPGLGGFNPNLAGAGAGGQVGSPGLPPGMGAGGGIPTPNVPGLPQPPGVGGTGPMPGVGGINAGRPANQQYGLGPYNDLALNMSYNRYAQPQGPTFGGMPGGYGQVPGGGAYGGYGGGWGGPPNMMHTMPLTSQQLAQRGLVNYGQMPPNPFVQPQAA